MIEELYNLLDNQNALQRFITASINDEVAKLLRELARHSDNVWKSTSYTRAAENIQNLEIPITEVERLKDIEGVGKDISDEIQEYIETGKIEKLEKLKETAKEKRPFTAEEVLQKTKPLWDAADELGLKYELTGSIRRKETQVRDIDAIILIDQVDQWSSLIEELDHFNAKGKQVLDFIINGISVNLRAAEPEDWEATVLFFTGPGSNTIYLRQQAKKKGWKLNRYGLFDKNGKIITKKEKEIFKALEIPWVEPENR